MSALGPTELRTPRASSWRAGVITLAVALAVVAIVWVLLDERERQREAERERIQAITEENRMIRDVNQQIREWNERRARAARARQLREGVPGGVPVLETPPRRPGIGPALLEDPRTLEVIELAQTQLDCLGELRGLRANEPVALAPILPDSDPALADFDGDGRLDVVTRVAGKPTRLRFHPDPTGNSRTQTIELPRLLLVAAVEDQPGPGADILAIQAEVAEYRCNANVLRYRADGLELVEQWTTEIPDTCLPDLGARVLDIDGDDAAELVIHRGSAVSIHELGSSERPRRVAMASACDRQVGAGTRQELLIADLDGDARPELVLSAGSDMLVVGRNDAGEFECRQADETTCSFGSSPLHADIDGDGSRELWWVCDQRTLQRWDVRSDRTLKHAATYAVHERRFIQVIAANLDDDPADELIALVGATHDDRANAGKLLVELLDFGEQGLDVLSETRIDLAPLTLLMAQRSAGRVRIAVGSTKGEQVAWFERGECRVRSEE